MKAYLAYKDSRAEWIGNIPNHWESIRLKYLFEEIYRYPTYYGIDYEEQGVLEIRGLMLKQGGMIDTANNPRYISLETSNKFPRTQLQSGDLVMSVRGTLGKIGLVTEELAGSNITANLMRLSPIRKKAFSKFLVYLMRSDYFANILDFVSDQTTIKTITVPSLVVSRLPIPPLPEQKTIADFLDRVTAQIDDLISKKQRQIDLLHEQRTALINRAVTKGLNPDAPMKDSGVEWLGEIPSHWEMVRLRHISPNISVGLVIQPSKYVDPEGTIPFLYGSNIRENEFLLDDVRKITEESNQIINNSMLHAGDLVTVRVGYPGVTAVIPPELDGCNCASMMIVRKSDFVLSEYLCYTMNSYVGMYQIGSVEYGAAQKQFNISHAVDFVYPIPPRNEQEEIINYLNEHEDNFKATTERLSRTIELLQEYRTALISGAVTGKIDVRA